VIEAILNTKPHKWNCSWNQPVLGNIAEISCGLDELSYYIIVHVLYSYSTSLYHHCKGNECAQIKTFIYNFFNKIILLCAYYYW